MLPAEHVATKRLPIHIKPNTIQNQIKVFKNPNLRLPILLCVLNHVIRAQFLLVNGRVGGWVAGGWMGEWVAGG